MITSWKNLIYALEQMRQLQKNPAAVKNPGLRFRLKRAEAEVDACIAQKIEEWANQSELKF